MPAGMTNGEINRLGKRLRTPEAVGPDDLALLQQLREVHDDALAEVARTLREELGLEPTTRLKTVNTLVDKIRREHMKLSEVQDIAGARITLRETNTRIEQDEVVARLVARFPGCKVIDRRVKPTFGYRAVHLVVRTLDCRVEIQVRTQLQHVWAQMVESLADSWGRPIRYGGEPEDPGRAGPAGVTRRDAWADALKMAEALDELEQVNVARAPLRERLDRLRWEAETGPEQLALMARIHSELQDLTSEFGSLEASRQLLHQRVVDLAGRVGDALAADRGGRGDDGGR